MLHALRRRRGWRWLSSLLPAVLAFAFVNPAAAFEPAGLWLTQLKAEILIAPCADGYCGIVAKPVKPGLHDINNPDPQLRGRPIEGLPLIWISQGGQPQVWDARLYNPLDGKMYSGVVQMSSEESLHLRGCVFFIFCKAEEWERLE